MSYIFLILGFFYRVMFLLSINLFVGCMGVLFLYFLYFYCLFIEYNYIYLKTVFIPCIMSFYVFLDNCDRDSYMLRKHPNFLYIREQLKKEHYKNNLSLLSKFCLIPTVLFFRLDTHVMSNVIIINNSYNEILQHIEKHVINLDSSEIKKRYQILKDQK